MLNAELRNANRWEKVLRVSTEDLDLLLQDEASNEDRQL